MMIALQKGNQVAFPLALKAVDKDLGYNGKLLFAISAGNDDSCFEIGMDDGVITVASPLDRERRDTYDLTVTCYDSGEPQKFAAHVIKIDVLDANDNAPRFDRASYSRDVVEDARTGTTVVTVSATDPDLGENGRVRYKLVGGGGGVPFKVHPSTGAVILVGELDREVRDRYELRVRAYDSGDVPRWSETSVRVQVRDVNDNPPRFSQSFYEVRAREDLPVGSVILTVTAGDDDLLDAGDVRYSFLSNDGGKFVIDELTGTIRIASRLDFEETMVYNLTVVAGDRGAPALSTKTYVLVEVADVNENFHAPDFGGAYVLEGSVGENLAPGVEVMTVRASDDDDPGGIDSQLVYSLRGGSGLGYFDIDPTEGAYPHVRCFF
jgi:protocadherin Fat 1/2/3